MLDRFEKALKKRLTDYEEDPAPALWPAIKPTPRHSTSFGWMDPTEIFSIIICFTLLGWIIFSDTIIGDGKELYTSNSKDNIPTFIDTLNALKKYDLKENKKENSKSAAIDLVETNQETSTTNQASLHQQKKTDSLSFSTRVESPGKRKIEKRKLSTPDSVFINATTEATEVLNQTAYSETNNKKGEAVQASSEVRSRYPQVRKKISFSEMEIRKPVWKNMLFNQANEKLGLAKTDSAKRKRNSPFARGAIYIQATPLLSYQRVISNTRDNQYINELKSLPALSPRRIGLRIETGWQWDASERIKISLGVVYFQRKQELRYTTQSIERMETTENIAGKLVLTPVLNTESHQLQFDSKSIGASGQFTYRLTNKQVLNYVGAGIDYQLSLTRHNHADQLTEPSHYVFVNLFYRVVYPASKRVSLFLQPGINYTIDFNSNFNSPLYVKPYGIGLGLGATIKLTRD